MKLQGIKTRFYLLLLFGIVPWLDGPADGSVKREAEGRETSGQAESPKKENETKKPSSAQERENAPTGAESESLEKRRPVETSYKLGTPLGGYFDLTLLRSSRRIQKYRHVMDSLKRPLGPGKGWTLVLQVAVEFGSESGMAEMTQLENTIVLDIDQLLNRQDPPDLLTLPGKSKLKQEILETINRRLRTAQVRQIYFTEFHMYR